MAVQFAVWHPANLPSPPSRPLESRKNHLKFGLGKADKGLLRCYLLRTTGLSRTQLARLVARYLADRELRDRRRGAAWTFRRRYEVATEW